MFSEIRLIEILCLILTVVGALTILSIIGVLICQGKKIASLTRLAEILHNIITAVGLITSLSIISILIAFRINDIHIKLEDPPSAKIIIIHILKKDYIY